MSCKLSRRNVECVGKVKLLQRQPLPELADSPDCSDNIDSYPATEQSPGSGCNKNDDYDWHHSTCDSSTLGQSSSSFMSWADDMELETTQKVQQLLDDIDHVLYEEESDPGGSLQGCQLQECEEWKHKFPHLRLVGRSLPTKRCGNVDVVISDVEEVIASHGHPDEEPPVNVSGGLAMEDSLHSIRDEVCAHVWSEVARCLSTRQTLCDSTKGRAPLGDRHTACNLPVLSCTSVKSSSSRQRYKHVTLPPIENLQLSNKVMLGGLKSPGLFGEKMNIMTDNTADWRHIKSTAAGCKNSSASNKSAKNRRQKSNVLTEPKWR